MDILEAEAPDVVHIHQTNNGTLVQAIAARWPVLYFVHNHILTCPSGTRAYTASWKICDFAGPSPGCLSNAYVQRCNSRRPGRVLSSMLSCLDMRRAARGLLIGVDSTFMKETLVRSGFPAERLIVSPTVTEVVDRKTVEPRALRQVAYVGQLIAVKGLPLLLSALGRLPPDTNLKVAGHGPLMPDARKLTMRLGLESRVHFLGRLNHDEVRDLLRESAVLCVPAMYPEPFGLVGPEAMAESRPVVACAVGGIPEWLEHGVSGFLAAPNDAADLASRLQQVLDDRALGRQLGEAGRGLWEERLHPRHHVDCLIRAYETLVAL
jgi:glycosyltransferase involved in cell wall biosynthesis